MFLPTFVKSHSLKSSTRVRDDTSRDPGVLTLKVQKSEKLCMCIDLSSTLSIVLLDLVDDLFKTF